VQPWGAAQGIPKGPLQNTLASPAFPRVELTAPEHTAMLKVVARREVDLAAAWSVDRLGPFTSGPGRDAR